MKTGAVLQYPTQLENGKKNIPRNGPLDDHQGRRTVDAITNERGISKSGNLINQELNPTLFFSEKLLVLLDKQK